MSSKDQPNQSDIQPESGWRLPVTEDDVEGHMPTIRFRATDEPGIQPEGGYKFPFTGDDVEGHMPRLRFSAFDESGIEPEGTRKTPFTWDEPTEAMGHGFTLPASEPTTTSGPTIRTARSGAAASRQLVPATW